MEQCHLTVNQQESRTDGVAFWKLTHSYIAYQSAFTIDKRIIYSETIACQL